MHFEKVFYLFQLDVLDWLGGGPKGEQAGEDWEGLDGRNQPERSSDLQDGPVAQRPESGYPSGDPVLGGCLLRPNRDGLSQQLCTQGAVTPLI